MHKVNSGDLNFFVFVSLMFFSLDMLPKRICLYGCSCLMEIAKDLNITGSITSEVLVHAELDLLEINVIILQSVCVVCIRSLCSLSKIASKGVASFEFLVRQFFKLLDGCQKRESVAAEKAVSN